MSDITDVKDQITKMADKYREDLLVSVNDLLERLGKKGINILVISGTVLTAYLIVKAFVGTNEPDADPDDSDDERREIKRRPSRYSRFINKLSDRAFEQLLLFLLSMAKQKIVEYLIELEENNADSKNAEEKVE